MAQPKVYEFGEEAERCRAGCPCCGGVAFTNRKRAKHRGRPSVVATCSNRKCRHKLRIMLAPEVKNAN